MFREGDGDRTNVIRIGLERYTRPLGQVDKIMMNSLPN